MMNNKRNPPPTKIYKFYRINDDLKNTLRDNYIWLSNPNNFNDPFDCNKNLLTISPSEHNIRQLFNERGKSRRHRRDNFNHYKNRPVKIRKVINKTIEENIENYGVASFCEEYENILRWSHYADFHKGLCLCFDTEMDSELSIMGRVQYTKEFIPIDFFNSDPVDVIDKIFLTKSQEWNYEKEYRIFEVNSGKERGWRKLNFIKDALQEVIFGCKISE